ncbi:MAG: chorismate mutase, partial [Firmicutes bacterium]|nr:chorismate mutase [Bacillota bacterium]
MTMLDEYRKELDQIDESMTQLLEARMRVAEKIAAYKHDHHVPVLDARCEREVLDRITRYAAPDMAYYTRTMYNNIMEMSKDHQRKAVQEDTDLVKKIKQAIEETPKVFPATATIACAGVLG